MEKKIDKEKLQALLEREDLMKTLSDQGATAEDYVRVFKEVGIELSEEESAKVKEGVLETAKKIFDTPVEELNDSSLKEISGGAFTWGWALPVTVPATVIASIPSIGCYVASLVYDKKYQKALKEGKTQEAEKLKNKSDSAKKAANGLLALSAVPGTLSVLATGAYLTGH